MDTTLHDGRTSNTGTMHRTGGVMNSSEEPPTQREESASSELWVRPFRSDVPPSLAPDCAPLPGHPPVDLQDPPGTDAPNPAALSAQRCYAGSPIPLLQKHPGRRDEPSRNDCTRGAVAKMRAVPGDRRQADDHRDEVLHRLVLVVSLLEAAELDDAVHEAHDDAAPIHDPEEQDLRRRRRLARHNRRETISSSPLRHLSSQVVLQAFRSATDIDDPPWLLVNALIRLKSLSLKP